MVMVTGFLANANLEDRFLRGNMTDLPNEKQNVNLQEKSCADAAKTSARIKRMRGWLGVKSTSSLGGYADDSGGVVYGDGHSGWNR